MPITSLTEIWQSRSIDDNTKQKTAERAFLAPTATAVADAPDLWDTYPDDATLFVDNVIIERYSKSESKIIVHYSTPTSGGATGDGLTDVYELDVGLITKTEYYDKTNKQIKGPTGEAITLNVQRPHITYRRIKWMDTFNPNTAYGLVGKINNAIWWGRPIGTWLFRGVNARKEGDSANAKWRVDYVFEFDPDGWQPQIPVVSTTGNVETVTLDTLIVYDTANFGALDI